MSDPSRHWDKVYTDKRADEVSWRQSKPEISLEFIARAGVGLDAPLVDIGGGASVLVDFLLRRGHTNVTVLDLAGSALRQARERLGEDANAVKWVVADVTVWRPKHRYALWHDRAVLHFLTSADAQQAYANTLRAALEDGGWAIVAGFAPGGPETCSDLPIVQHDSTSLQHLLGDAFLLLETRDETHITPWGAEQAFRYHLFQRQDAR